jgi:programmed cell death 6-interacting protein
MRMFYDLPVEDQHIKSHPLPFPLTHPSHHTIPLIVVTMSNLIAVPAKKTSEVDLVKPLKNLIASYYSSSEQPVSFDESIEALNKLRKDSCSKNVDFKHDASLTLLEKYYDQLNSLEAKCPPTEIQIPFKWKDSLVTSSFLGSPSLTISSIAYEKVCILYNMAAAQSQLATGLVSDSLSNDAAMKSAAKYFCSSSGLFQALKHLVPNAVGSQQVTVDLQSDVLHALHLLMLSQAQEVFFYKAANDSMKENIIARIANQCEEFYSDALKQMQTKYWPDREWVPLVQAKQLAFKGIAEYYQAVCCGQAQNFGEQLCRLTNAIELLKSAESKSSLFPRPLAEYARKAATAYEAARKDNEFIYHARIPDYKSLTPIGKAALAKPTPIPSKFRADADLFEKLLPLSVQQAVLKLDVRKQEIVNAEIAAIRDLNASLNASLTSMNLPASIEDVSGVQLPPSLLAKAAAVRSAGGLDSLNKKLAELPDLLNRNREILEETERMLNAEEESDNSLRSQFKEKWTRMESSKLTSNWKDNIAKYRSIIQNAVDADNKVRQKFAAQKDRIHLLASSEQEILRSVPTGTSGVSDSPPVRRLRQLLEQTDALKNEREVIESELQNASFNEMKTKFLRALAQDGAINEAALSAESLGEIYGPLQKQVRDSRARQESLLNEIQAANAEYVRSKGGVTGRDAQRENILAELAAAHDAYFEITNNVSTDFFPDISLF